MIIAIMLQPNTEHIICFARTNAEELLQKSGVLLIKSHELILSVHLAFFGAS